MTLSRVGRPTVRRLAASVALVLLTASCRPGKSAYFSQTSSAAQSGSAPVGTKVYAGIATLEIQPGDRVTFVSVETMTAGVRALVAPLRATNGVIGLARAGDLAAADLAPYRDLGSPSFSSEDGPIGIIIEITTPASQVDVVSPVLTFTVNGKAPEHEPLLMAVRVCPGTGRERPVPRSGAAPDGGLTGKRLPLVSMLTTMIETAPGFFADTFAASRSGRPIVRTARVTAQRPVRLSADHGSIRDDAAG